MTLEELREQINALDASIVPLLARRMETSLRIADAKRSENKRVFDPAREAAVLSHVERILSGDTTISPDAVRYIKEIYKSIMSLSKRAQYDKFTRDDAASTVDNAIFSIVKAAERRNDFPGSTKPAVRVACQGIDGAYSAIAARKMFVAPSLVFVPTWNDVVARVRGGDCEFGILPIENSTAGSVHAVYDLLGESGSYIVRSHKLRVEHSLLGKPGHSLSDVKEIVSHEQALSQCSEFLARQTGVKITSCPNTAVAAKIASDSDGTVAAIASSECAGIYNLATLAKGIVKGENNYTRFICVSRSPIIYKNASRTSFMLTLRNEPGTLGEVVSLFSDLGVNIRKLESRPISGSDFEFLFYFDVDCHPSDDITDSRFDDIIKRFPEITTNVVYLGSYYEETDT